jgi:hypothetical protein
MARLPIAMLLLLWVAKTGAYIDESTYTPVRLDTFAGAMHTIADRKLPSMLVEQSNVVVIPMC